VTECVQCYPLVRYPEGRNGGGGNTADIENALPFAFAIPGILFWRRRDRTGEGRGLDIPDAESGRRKKEERKILDHATAADIRSVTGGKIVWRVSLMITAFGHTHASTVDAYASRRGE